MINQFHVLDISMTHSFLKLYHALSMEWCIKFDRNGMTSLCSGFARVVGAIAVWRICILLSSTERLLQNQGSAMTHM